MIMKTALISMAVLVAGLLGQTRASPVSDSKLEACLKSVDAKIDAVKVPEDIRKLAEDVRDLNPNLQHLSLSRMVDEDSVVIDAEETGIVQDDKVDSMVQQCAGYVGSLMSIMYGTECGEELLVKSDSDYEGIMKGHAKLEELIGYAKVCTAAF